MEAGVDIGPLKLVWLNSAPPKGSTINKESEELVEEGKIFIFTYCYEK